MVVLQSRRPAKRFLTRRTLRCILGTLICVVFLLWAHTVSAVWKKADVSNEPRHQNGIDSTLWQIDNFPSDEYIHQSNRAVQAKAEDSFPVPRIAVDHPRTVVDETTNDDDQRVLSFYLEPPSTLDATQLLPLPPRRASASFLHKIQFPEFQINCTTGLLANFPIDAYPESDPFLPWIHDYFLLGDAVHFVAQNKRRCDTGEGREQSMKFWEPQIALFQPVPLKEVNTSRYLSTLEEATAPETRFICRFHDEDGSETITYSQFPFNYEYVNWRKQKGKNGMFVTKGADVSQFEFSSLLFSCPIPAKWHVDSMTGPSVWLDLIPIRTPPRRSKRLFGKDHVGPQMINSIQLFDAATEFGRHLLPSIENSGRIANLPVCPLPDHKPPEKHQLVICTWTAAAYKRRGDKTTINDASARLREWIVFHQLAGVDHIYIYDNTRSTNDGFDNSIQEVSRQFSDFVTHVPWQAKVCNNNRPNHKNPGERSSQYAAESSCRERFGPRTTWMSFIDIDEYLVPMINGTWKSVLDNIQSASPEVKVLKMRSSRGRPREPLMDPLEDQSMCKPESRRKRKEPLDPCLEPRKSETYLRVYNCDFIKPPRPDRFARAMKQIYQPSFVQSHFVHYSTITRSIATYYRDWNLSGGRSIPYSRSVEQVEWGDRFLDELAEGVLVHTKSVLPYETMTRTANCKQGRQHSSCGVGRVCPETTPFNDSIHQLNVFVDEAGEFCNCWINEHVERHWIPKLVTALNHTNTGSWIG